MDILLFLDSKLFSTLVTIATGCIAFVVYIKKQRDHKRDAANIILLEIQNAERCLKKIRENILKDKLEENYYTMKTDSWSVYKYLFVRHFDRDEWDLITEFYQTCQLIDTAIMHQSSMFQRNEEQLRINMLKNTAEYIDKAIQSNVDQNGHEALVQLATQFQNEYLLQPELTLYTPIKPINDVKKYLSIWTVQLSQTSIGSKFKRIAKIRV